MTSSARPYVIEEYTRTVCPQCADEHSIEYSMRSDDAQTWKDGMLVSHSGSVWLRRWCARHGETESLYEESLELWQARRGWSTPTSQIIPDRADNFAGFPNGYARGLPASHGQHTCILVLNITDRCNYGCTTCYASALAPGTASRDEKPTIDDVLFTVQTIIAREGGKLSVLMLSGGEPTVRDDLQQLIERLLPLPITRIVLNTNGRRIARDDKFLSFLQLHRNRIEVYLQFDGTSTRTYQALRNEDVLNEKMATLGRLNSAQIWTTLTMTVRRGVNENQIGEVARLALESPSVSGLALQPMFGSGRAPDFDPSDRGTPTGVIKRLEEQGGGLFQTSDFIPLPCSHRDCCDISYFLKTPDENWKSLPALVGRDELKRWLHLVSNTISFDNLSEPLVELLKSGALSRIWSEQMPTSATKMALDLGQMCDCVPGLQPLLGGLWKVASRKNEHRVLEALAQRTFRVTVKMFMDAHTLHEARIRQCCVHTGTFEEDPRRFSFCWRWIFPNATDFPEREVQTTFVPLSTLK